MNKQLFAIMLVVGLTTNYVQAQFAFGLRAGLNLTNFTEKFNDKKVTDTNYIHGYQAGIVGEFAVSNVCAVQPAIIFTTQGGEKYQGMYSIKINYLQIPINALYKINLGNVKLLLQAGPYLGIALGGKYKVDDMGVLGGEFKIKFGNKADEMKPVDVGFGLGTGLQFKNFQAGLNYNFGIANLYNVTEDYKKSLKINGLSVTLTYLFGNEH